MKLKTISTVTSGYENETVRNCVGLEVTQDRQYTKEVLIGVATR